MSTQTINEYLKPTNDLVAYIDEHVDKTEKCYLGWPHINLQKVLMNRSGVSDSIVVMGSTNPFAWFENDHTVVVKLSFKSNDANDNSLALEGKIYQYVIKEMRDHTPNLMTFLSNTRCNDFHKIAKKCMIIEEENSVCRDLYASFHNFYNDNKYDTTKINILVTKKAGGKQSAERVL